MRTVSLALVALATFAGPSLGQKVDTPPVKEIIIGGQPPSSELSGENTENCVEVEIGGDKVFNCLNDKLKRQSERVIPLPNIAPIDSHSSDIRLGIANMPAVKQQYGKNFGNSVFPYRPAPPVYSPPFGPR